MKLNTRKIIGIWLIIGLVMIFVQVILGGVTRLTDSGLSITEWKVIKGVLPPMNEVDWNIAFEKYRNMANQQFEHLHADMDLPAFKKIYFWEWFHRLWARSMGFVFLLPFLYFLKKRMMPSWLLKRLGVVILLAALVASLGWIMVASGFENEQRTWVSAYKLSMHLGVAALLFWYLFNTSLFVFQENTVDFKLLKFEKASKLIVFLIFTQILFGGLMAGMRAGAIHPHFPFFIGNNSLIHIITYNTSFSFESIINYESNNFIKAIVQILHRSFAWLILILTVRFFFKIKQENISRKLYAGIVLSMIIISIQFTLGVFTIINYTYPEIMVPLGVLHQAVAFISLIVWVFVNFQLNENKFN